MYFEFSKTRGDFRNTDLRCVNRVYMCFMYAALHSSANTLLNHITYLLLASPAHPPVFWHFSSLPVPCPHTLSPVE